MTIEDAIKYALEGKAVLFLGAGFSCHAKNLDNENIYTGNVLLVKLRKYLKLSNDTHTLSQISEYYMRQYGEAKLVDLLKKKFIVTEKGISDDQKIISNLPWTNIYTTNYDNIVEIASNNEIKPVVLSDQITIAGAKCVHLNGYVEKIDVNTIRSEIKLTSSSYDQDNTDSPWFGRFNSEIKAASAIIFVGYSMPDLDIRRLFVSNDSLFAKCIFIDSPDLDPISKSALASFGEVYTIGVQKFAKKIQEQKKNFIPRQSGEMHLLSFEEYTYSISAKNVTDKDFFNLLLKGVYDNSLAETQPYLLRRNETDKIVKVIDEGKIPVIYSALANGKTKLLNSACNQLAADYRIFFLKANSDTLIEEFKKIANLSYAIIVIENYNSHFDELRTLAPFIQDNLRIILTARSNAHDYFYERLHSILPGQILVDCNCDELDADAISWLSKAFDHYGFWGRYTSESIEWKNDFLSGKIQNSCCNQQFHSILLYLIKSPEIRQRISEDFNLVQQNPTTCAILNAISILEVIFGEVTIDDIEIIFGPSILNSDLIRGNDPLRNFIDFQRSKISIKSAALALFFLEKEDPKITIRTLVKIHNAYTEAKQDSERYQKLSVQLVRFANLSLIFPNDTDGIFIQQYYSAIKSHWARCKDPLFWLQYATACTETGDYDAAEKYFAVSRGCAKSRINFNSYQIDNREAIFLLKRAISDHDFSAAKSMFLQAKSFIQAGFNNPWGTDKIRKPFRPTILFFDFWNEYEDEIIADLKMLKNLSGAINNALRKLDELPKDIASHPELVECRNKLSLLQQFVAMATKGKAYCAGHRKYQ